MDGRIFSIEEFSVFDGPGIRTTVFFKGCPLRCSWCHNPEGQLSEEEILKNPNGCLHCGECLKYAIKMNGKTVYSKDSIRHCPRNLLRVSGETISSDDLVLRLIKNKDLLSGGGVTFSGGEPLFQPEFLAECLEKLRNLLHTAVQTSGFCDTENFSKILGSADYFLFDLKLADPVMHRRYTGVSNECIAENFHRLAQSKKDFTVRIPLIPNVTDTEENLTGIAELLLRNKVYYAELLPYNRLAGSKYPLCGRTYRPDFDPNVGVEFHEELFSIYGIRIKVL